MFDILWICLTYCIGSVPFGLVFAKTFCRIDPRTAGSGNVGATNVARLCGKAWGAATLACDLLKGTIPVFIAIIRNPCAYSFVGILGRIVLRRRRPCDRNNQQT